ncbi:hypothetical protein Hdeb2414_s0016g00488631 [Helianthus debilis subsp. tardiflorus]
MLDQLLYQKLLKERFLKPKALLKLCQFLLIVAHVFSSLTVLQKETLDQLVLGSCYVQSTEVWFIVYVKV